MITIVGPTATGKTALAVGVARRLGNCEIISADSRQIYRGMDIGTGKDIAEYTVGGETIPYHLIDIADAGYKYNLYEYQRDFMAAYNDIVSRGKTPILCGGTGLYIEAILGGYQLLEVPANQPLRESLEKKTLDELTAILAAYPNYRAHNTTDIENCRRAIRAIEIAEYYSTHEHETTQYPDLNPITIGVGIDRELRRERISKRLYARLEEGMVDEVRRLIESGIAPDDLIYYGLEYKFLTKHIIGELSYNDMVQQLEIAIHQFAKRQMTWFRGMERRGYQINWINGSLPLEERIEQAIQVIEKAKTDVP